MAPPIKRTRNGSIAVLVLVLLPHMVRAETSAGETPAPQGLIDVGHAAVNRSITNIARSIDRFFAKTDIYTDTQGSWVMVGLGVRFRSDSSNEYISALAARLALPNTEKKYNLLLESNLAAPDPISANSPLSAVTTPVYSGGLRYIISDSRTWHLHFDTGIEFNVPVDAFVRLRANRTYPWTHTQLRLGDTVTKYQSGRENNENDIVLDWLLARYWLWRNSLTLKIAYPSSESNALFDSSLFHRIDERHALQLEAVAYGLDNPARAHEYQLNLRYRIRSKARDWVFYEIAPQRLYNEDNGFQPVTSLYLRVDFLFRG